MTVAIDPKIIIGRIYRNKKLKAVVKETAPHPNEKDLLVVDEDIMITTIDDDYDMTPFKEVPISSSEADKWKSILSAIAGETSKIGTAEYAIHGLLKCDVPIKDLCRIKANPDAMRGFIYNDSKIIKHASFTEAGLTNMAPLMVFQLLAFVTSQYYQQIITERLIAIEAKLDNILKHLEANDMAELKVAYNELVSLSKKRTYDISDKDTAYKFLNQVQVIREKYRIIVSNINPPAIDWSWSDKKEAEHMIKALYDSKYLDYLEIALQAELLVFIASAICMRIADKLENEEDLKRFAERMDPDFWNEYENKFNSIRHVVMATLELEAGSSLFQSEFINSLKDEMEMRFKEVDNTRKNLQEIYAQRTVQYIRIHEDGTVKKYMTAR